MQFSIVALFASSALAVSSTITSLSTEVDTIYSCAETVTDCPYRNHTSSVSTFEGAANGAHGSYYAAGAVALAAGALLM